MSKTTKTYESQDGSIKPPDAVTSTYSAGTSRSRQQSAMKPSTATTNPSYSTGTSKSRKISAVKPPKKK